MLEARLKSAGILKKILDAIKDLIREGTFDCSNDGIELQSMDSSHIALVALTLRADGFEKFRCSRNQSMSINLISMSKILKCANNDDIVTLKAQDNADTVTIVIESKNRERVSDYEMKLMNLDQDHLGIPETDYSAVACIPAMEFARICRDLAQFSETMIISCTKENIKFSANGDMGTANVKLLPTATIDNEEKAVIIKIQKNVELRFSSRFLNSITKATPLAYQVKLSMSENVPLEVEYRMPDLGHLRYYLAPQVDDVNDS